MEDIKCYVCLDYGRILYDIIDGDNIYTYSMYCPKCGTGYDGQKMVKKELQSKYFEDNLAQFVDINELEERNAMKYQDGNAERRLVHIKAELKEEE